MSDLKEHADTPMTHLPEDDLAALKDVVGDFDPAKGMNAQQQSTLSVGMMMSALSELQSAGQPDTILERLWGEDHFTVAVQDGVPGQPFADRASVFRVWTSNALKVILNAENGGEFLGFVRSLRGTPHDLKGFAGPLCADHKLQSANTWYEINFPAGHFPGVVPARDIVGDDTKIVRIKRIAIHAIHANCVNPFPRSDSPIDVEAQIAQSPNFLRTAIVTAYIEDALNRLYTFSGTVSYGYSDGTGDGSKGGRPGGAKGWRVMDAEEHITAMHGEHPNASLSHIPQPISGLTQFAFGTLAYLLSYFKAQGDDFESMSRQFHENSAIVSQGDAQIDFGA